MVQRKTFSLFAVLFLVIGLGFLAMPRSVSAQAGPAVALEQCANNSDGSNGTCANGPNLGWMNSKLGGNNALYFLGDFYPNRQVYSNLTAGNTYCFGFGFDYTKSNLPAVDYVGTYNASLPNADPTIDTPFTLGVSMTDTLPLPQEPATLNGGTISGFPFIGVYEFGELTLWGGNFVPVTGTDFIVYSNPGSTDLGVDFQQSAEYCFLADGTDAIVAFGARISEPFDWGLVDRPTGSPYHVSNGTRNGQFTAPRTSQTDLVEIAADGVTVLSHNNVGRTEQQIADSAIGEPNPLAISLSDVRSPSGAFPVTAGLAFIVLALGSLYLALRRPAATEKGNRPV